MAKGAYVGVDGVAHKVKKIYTGVDNVAKQVKKGYVGVGGVARPFFSSDGLEYYGAITPLSVGREQLSATTVGNYALFGGGQRTFSTDKDTVDAYDATLTRSTPTALSVARECLAATTVGNYALFGGGGGSIEGYSYTDTVDAYVDSVGAEIPSHLSIDGGEGDYDLIDLIDGTITKIARNYSDFITLKRGHAYRFALSDPDSSMWKKIRNIDASVNPEVGYTSYEYNGAIGYDGDTIYIAPNISVPTGYTGNRFILTITVYFNII